MMEEKIFFYVYFECYEIVDERKFFTKFLSIDCVRFIDVHNGIKIAYFLY